MKDDKKILKPINPGGGRIGTSGGPNPNGRVRKSGKTKNERLKAKKTKKKTKHLKKRDNTRNGKAGNDKKTCLAENWKR